MSQEITQKVVVETSTRGIDSLKQLEKQIRRIVSLTNIGKLQGNVAGFGGRQRNAADSARKAFAIDAAGSKRALAFVERMRRQRLGEAAAVERAEAKAARSNKATLKAKLGFLDRMARQRLSEEKAVARATAGQARASAADLRRRLGFAARMNTQKASELRAAAAEQSRTARAAAADLKRRLGFSALMSRQRAREQNAEARAQAAAEREKAAAARKRISLDNYRFGLRDRHQNNQGRERRRDRADALHHGRDAGHHASDAVTRSTRSAAAAGAIGVAGSAALARRSLGAESEIDTAEVNSRIYGGLTKQSARDLRSKWAEPLAEKLGIGTDKLLTSYVDALKLGIPSEGAKSFSGLATKTSEAWGVEFGTVSDILGTVNSLLTSDGSAFNFDKIKGVANSIQYLSQKQSTTPERLISFLQRGAGASQVLGMSQSAGVAFGSASTSLGNQPAESGRLMDYIASRIVDLPKTVRKNGDEGKEARELVRALGYSSANDLDARRRANPDEFLPDFFDRFSKIVNPKVQERGLRSFFGREWFGEGSRIVRGNSIYQEAAKLEKDSRQIDAIEEVWKIHVEKLSFTGKQISAGFKNILGEFGKELSPIARQFGDYFLGWTQKLRQGGLRHRFRAAIEGFVQGLGFQDVPALLNGFFGKPGEGAAGSITVWADAARGFGEGLRDIGRAVRSFLAVFTGQNAGPDAIGRWTGRILAFGAACVVVAPAVAILGSLSSAIIAFALAAGAAWRIMRSMGLVGAAVGVARGAAGSAGAAAEGVAVGTAATASTGLLGRLLGTFGLGGAAGAALTLDPSKEDQEAMMLRLGKWGARRNEERVQNARPWVDPPRRPIVETPARTLIQPPITVPPTEGMRGIGQGIENLRRSIDETAKVQRQSFWGDAENGPRSLITRASFGGDDARSIRASIEKLGGKVQLAALGNPTLGTSTGSSARTFAGSIGGAAGSSVVVNPGPGISTSRGVLGRRGILGGSGSDDGAVGGGGSSPQGDGTGNRGPANAGRMMAYAMDQLRREGVPESNLKRAAAHLVGQATMESGLDPNKLHDGGTGYGIYGARDPNGRTGRRSQMLAWLAQNGYARNSVEGQMRYMTKEAMSGRFKATRRILMGDSTGSLDNDTNTITREFESPKVVNRRSHAVQNALNVGPQGDGGGSDDGISPSAPLSSSGDVLGRMRSLRASGAVVNEQCVALAKAAVGVSGSVTSWRKGVGAAAGTLQPGTPIATFLNRDGSQASRYAGGGTGTPGAGLDHAAVFESYAKDAAGRIVGMNVAEQYKGSGGVRAKRYMFGAGFGEKNGANYHAVLGPDLKHLGGDRSPMSSAGLVGSGWHKSGEQPRRALGVEEKPASIGNASKSSSEAFKSEGWASGWGGNARPDSATDKGPENLADTIRRSVGAGITMPLPDRLRERMGAGVAKLFSQNMPALASPTVTPGEAAQNLPARIGADHSPEALARTVPENPMNRIAGDWKKGLGSNAPALHAPITIHGGNSDPEALANLVQRRIQDSHRTREHDLDYQSI